MPKVNFYFFSGSKFGTKIDISTSKPVFSHSHETLKTGFRAPLPPKIFPPTVCWQNALDPIKIFYFFKMRKFQAKLVIKTTFFSKPQHFGVFLKKIEIKTLSPSTGRKWPLLTFKFYFFGRKISMNRGI